MKPHRIILAVLVLAFTALTSAVGFWKYAHFLYNGLDLAIYTNVLASLARGTGWASSIQGHSYLGDHVEPILLALVPFFRVLPDPRLLIVAQALMLGLTAVPIFLLLRDARVRAPFVLTALWLANPLLWNAAIFEFHALAFAPLFLLSAAVLYQRKRFAWCVAFLLLTIAVREDVALIVAMFGALALLEHRRPRRWIVVPAVLGGAWFTIATRVIATHNPSGHSPFLAYYGWLGDSFPGVLWGALTHPLAVLGNIVSVGNLDMVLGLLLPFLLLPILAPRWTILALPPLAQVFLGRTGGSNIIVDLHYGLLFVPALATASIATLSSIISPPPVGRGGEGGWGMRLTFWIKRHLPLPKRFACVLAIATALGAAAGIGPFFGIARSVVYGVPVAEVRRDTARAAIVARVPKDAVVSATSSLLPRVAARQGTSSTLYVALGIQQFANGPYALPDQTSHLLMDARELREELHSFATLSWAREHSAGAAARFLRIVEDGDFRIIAQDGDVLLLARGGHGPLLDASYFAPHPDDRYGPRIIGPLREITSAE